MSSSFSLFLSCSQFGTCYLTLLPSLSVVYLQSFPLFPTGRLGQRSAVTYARRMRLWNYSITLGAIVSNKETPKIRIGGCATKTQKRKTQKKKKKIERRDGEAPLILQKRGGSWVREERAIRYPKVLVCALGQAADREDQTKSGPPCSRSLSLSLSRSRSLSLSL